MTIAEKHKLPQARMYLKAARWGFENLWIKNLLGLNSDFT